ncbi:glycosyltransferase family 2 protein [Catenovulum maritimum]|uniref:glycosyltransferase family 2 protein n=1 Tax=Catenovulum maritimum TaxID=1513271 RepID=UPI00065F7A87|nr:glycosyltransferase family 2 protein [Catenovulum maritimum]
MNILLWFIILTVLLAFVYHHWVYPVVLKKLAKGKLVQLSQQHLPKNLPKISILVPVYNEAQHLLNKVTNLAALDYPRDKLSIHFGLDGCTDNSAKRIKDAMTLAEQNGLNCQLHEFKANKGKIQVMNKLISKLKHQADILVMTDASALISIDALKVSVINLQNQNIAVVSGKYLLAEEGNQNEQAYWTMQNDIRINESKLGSSIGVPGAFFAIRNELASELSSNVINDDFVMPMMAVIKGYRAIIDDRIQIVEMQPDSTDCELKRRMRLGAGNLQQLFICKALINFSTTGLCFFSSKFLRGALPLGLFSCGISLMYLAVAGSVVALALTLVILAAIVSGFCAEKLNKRIPLCTMAYYAFSQYVASFVGQIFYFLGRYDKSWSGSVNKLKSNVTSNREYSR